LQGEHPRGVATVLSCLDPSRAGETLMRLPPEVRKEVFPRLKPTAGQLNDLALRIVRAVVAKSRAAAAAPEQPDGDDKAQMMADMLRSMDRNDRSDLMNALTERDEALAAAVRERLYVFDDLGAIEGQSMQKLLAEIDAKTLAVALQNAPEIIFDKVMTNLSKRARESLKEEMSFLEATPAVQVQQARKSVVDVIQRMDLAGELG
jgi:flagellar motor switch protein FliG